MDNLIQFLEKHIPLHDKSKNFLRTGIENVSLRKKQSLLEPGQTNKNLYFIKQGILRGYTIQKRKDVTTWFSFENEFSTSLTSFLSGDLSFEGIEALEDSELFSISREKLYELYIEFPEFERVGRILIERFYIELEMRLVHLQFKSARERYSYFLKNYSHLSHRIPLTHIASYLGITKETLSRIRS